MPTFREAYPLLLEPFPILWHELKPGAQARDGGRALAMPYVDWHRYQDRLDAAAGPDGWRVEYRQAAEAVWVCRLEILGLAREDIGESEDDEPQAATTGKRKGAHPAFAGVAQAFRRACASFGLGRYLYTLAPVFADYDAQKRKFTGDVAAVVAEIFRKSGFLPVERLGRRLAELTRRAAKAGAEERAELGAELERLAGELRRAAACGDLPGADLDQVRKAYAAARAALGAEAPRRPPAAPAGAAPPSSPPSSPPPSEPSPRPSQGPALSSPQRGPAELGAEAQATFSAAEERRDHSATATDAPAPEWSRPRGSPMSAPEAAGAVADASRSPRLTPPPSAGPPPTSSTPAARSSAPPSPNSSGSATATTPNGSPRSARASTPPPKLAGEGASGRAAPAPATVADDTTAAQAAAELRYAEAVDAAQGEAELTRLADAATKECGESLLSEPGLARLLRRIAARRKELGAERKKRAAAALARSTVTGPGGVERPGPPAAAASSAAEAGAVPPVCDVPTARAQAYIGAYRACRGFDDKAEIDRKIEAEHRREPFDAADMRLLDDAAEERAKTLALAEKTLKLMTQ